MYLTYNHKGGVVMGSGSGPRREGCEEEEDEGGNVVTDSSDVDEWAGFKKKARKLGFSYSLCHPLSREILLRIFSSGKLILQLLCSPISNWNFSSKTKQNIMTVGMKHSVFGKVKNVCLTSIPGIRIFRRHFHPRDQVHRREGEAGVGKVRLKIETMFVWGQI